MVQWNITVECGVAESEDNIGVRISSIFVIGIGSLLGALLPVWLARTKHAQDNRMEMAFFVVKYFGSGVIIATAFIHLLAPATEALQTPCLTGPITDYDWAEGIALMTVFTMFFIELLAARMEFGAGHDHADVEASKFTSQDAITDPKTCEGDASKYKHSGFRKKQYYRMPEQDDCGTGIVFDRAPEACTTQENTLTSNAGIINNAANRLGSCDGATLSGSRGSLQVGTTERIPAGTDFSYPPGGADHLSHAREHDQNSGTAKFVAAQLTSIFILEFGVIFHSVFIGLTLAVAGSEFTILYIVLTFHQTFEGLGLGTRLALTPWPDSKKWLPWLLGTVFGFTTPIAIAIGLGVREAFQPGSPGTLIANGVFDSISAGILIYTGLVELMAHEFMFNEEMRKASISHTMFAFFCMCFGAGLMALLGKWA